MALIRPSGSKIDKNAQSNRYTTNRSKNQQNTLNDCYEA